MSEQTLNQLLYIYLFYSENKLQLVTFIFQGPNNNRQILVGTIEEHDDRFNLLRLLQHNSSMETLSPNVLYYQLERISSFKIEIRNSNMVVDFIAQDTIATANVGSVDSEIDHTIKPSLLEFGKYQIQRLSFITNGNGKPLHFYII